MLLFVVVVVVVVKNKKVLSPKYTLTATIYDIHDICNENVSTCNSAIRF